ncbi:MAG: hypothetical protein WC538_10390 [Thermoanaerobaculia bacterium]
MSRQPFPAHLRNASRLQRAVGAVVVLLLACAFPASAGEVRPVAPPASGPMAGISSLMSVAFGPDGGFAAWRVGFDAIFGVALDRDGQPTGPARLVLRDALGTIAPTVQFVDGSFEVWWLNGYPSLARTARIDANGIAIGLKTLAVNATPIATNGIVTLALGNVVGAEALHVIDRSGGVVRSTPLSPPGDAFGLRAVTLADGSFAVVTLGWSGMSLSRFSPSGDASGGPVVIEASRGTTAGDYRPTHAAAATDGSSVLIVWEGSAYGQLPELKSVVIGRDNSLSPWQQHDSHGWKSIVSIDAQWADGEYSAVMSAGQWQGSNTDDLDVYAARFTATGATTIDGFVPVVVRPGLEIPLALRSSGHRHLLFFQQGDYGMNELLGVVLPTTGSLSRPDLAAIDLRISISAANQAWPVAASDGNGWLVAWHEQTADREEIRCLTLAADGTPATPAVTLTSAFRYLGRPAVAFNGIDYVVAWGAGSSIVARRVRRDGTIVDVTPLAVATDTFAQGITPTLAGRDGVTLVAWSSGAVHATLLNADGTTTSSFPVSPPPREEGQDSISFWSPVVAAGSDGFLVAFTESRLTHCGFPPCDSSEAARGQLLTRNGAARGPMRAFDELPATSAAAAGGTYLAAFPSGRAAIIEESSANVLRTLAIASEPGVPSKALAASGEYLVASDHGDGSILELQRFAPDGGQRAIQTMDGIALPSAVSASGVLLAVAARNIDVSPYFGATGIQAQLIDTFRPGFPPARRRPVRR